MLVQYGTIDFRFKPLYIIHRLERIYFTKTKRIKKKERGMERGGGALRERERETKIKIARGIENEKERNIYIDIDRHTNR